MEIKQIIGVDGLDLLGTLLDINPDTRISAYDAIHHPFFNDFVISDPQYEVVNEIKHYGELMKSNEDSLFPNARYIDDQKYITESMRAVLIDWLIDVSIHFEVMTETLHYAISYIDRTLSKIEIEKT
jgi:serine/threonine protein kinase